MISGFLPQLLAVLPWVSADSSITGWFHQRLSPGFATILEALSEPGSPMWIAPIVIGLILALCWKRHWHSLVTLVLTVPCGALLCVLLKLLIKRNRPYLSGPMGVWGGYSFPSGHTIAATLLYGFLVILLAPNFSRRRWRWGSVLIAISLILGVGFSRIAMGAHYLTDVIGAIVIGVIWISFCSISVGKIKRRQRVSEADSPEPATVLF